MVGKTLGHYEILEPLGAGGMGEVYLGEDTRLGRKVAVKVLPGEFASDQERLARFEQEARAAAALNHPHIAVVHDVGSESGDDGETTHFIVQEFLEGQSLRDRLDKGAMPLGEALDLSVEVGEALVAAHAAGIVHRDLKPDNIFITQEGHAKVLDFGLAKLTEAAAATGATDLTMSPTMLGTVAGQVMGTAGYMSPEQVEGGEVDHRTDIFGFGCVLYEMASGRQPFAGRTVHHTLDRVLSEEPTPVREVNANLPAQLQWILQKCLAKPPSHRYQHADDLVVDFVALRKGFESGSLVAEATVVSDTPSGNSSLARGLAAAFATIAVVATAVAVSNWPSAGIEAPVEVSELVLSPSHGSLLLFDDIGSAVAIAPDASRVVAVVSGRQGRMLVTRKRGDSAFEPIPYTEGGDMPFFSPDSNQIGFVAAGKLKIVGFTGAPAIGLGTVTTEARGGAWREDGRIVIGHSGVVGGQNGVRTTTTDPDDGFDLLIASPLENEENEGDNYRYPQFLTDDLILLTIEGPDETGSASAKRMGIWSIADEDWRVEELGVTGTHARYVSTGHLLYARESQLFAIRFDLDDLQTIGEEILVLDDLHVDANVGFAHFDVANDGTLVYAESRSFAGVLSWVDANGNKDPIANEKRYFLQPTLSPDQTRALVWRFDGDRERVSLYDLANNDVEDLSPGPEDFGGAWLDDDTIIYAGVDPNEETSNASDRYYESWLLELDGISRPALLKVQPDQASGTFDQYSKHPHEDLWALTSYHAPGNDIWTFRMGDEEAQAFWPNPDGNESAPAFSPLGTWLAFVSDESGVKEVSVMRYPEWERRHDVSIGGGAEPAWSPDGTAVYFLQHRTMMVRSFDPETGELGDQRELFNVDQVPGRFNVANYDVAEDGRFLLLLGDETNITTELKLIRNWFRVLEDAFSGTGSGR